MELYNLLEKSCKDLGIQLTNEQIEQFLKYKKLLLEWNKNVNLTAITEEREIILRHFVDCLSCIKSVDLNNELNIIDIGTGAGFPGIPIKIAFEKTKVTLVDSLNKRINFLKDVIEKLEIKDVECVHSRAEELGQNLSYRENFDLCVSRAVANLSVLSEYCLPFIKIGGHFVALKGVNIDEELEKSKNAINILGGEIIKIDKVKIPNSEINHSLILIKKVTETPEKYPRKSSKVSKSPLK